MNKFPWFTVGITLLIVGGGIWAYGKYKSTTSSSTSLFGRAPIRILT